MLEVIQEIDSQLLLAFNGLRAEGLDAFIKWVSAKAVWIPFYISIAAVIIKHFGLKRGLLLLGAIALAVGCSDLVGARIIRPLAERLRPSNLDNPLSAVVVIVDGYRGGRFGFPSCHAANTFALAVCSSLILRSRAYTAFIFLWALLQCYSRMYLGVHYPGDLMAGAVLGSLLGWGAAALARRLWHPTPYLPDRTALIPIATALLTLIILAFLH